MSKYNEIHKLHEMLLDAGIKHEWLNRNPNGLPHKGKYGYVFDFGWQIVVYRPNGEQMISVIEGYGTYGMEDDLLEIMGLLTPEELEWDSVCGSLTAEDVFGRIERAVNETELQD